MKRATDRFLEIYGVAVLEVQYGPAAIEMGLPVLMWLALAMKQMLDMEELFFAWLLAPEVTP